MSFVKRKSLIMVICVLIGFVLTSCGHEHTWKDATCSTPKTCSECGETEGSTLEHEWRNATCQTPKTCTLCDVTEGTVANHTWLEATCTRPKTCKTCGHTEGIALGHAWLEATCISPKTCQTCNAIEGTVTDHAWSNATCTRPKTCKTCGHTEGIALGHAWLEATCISPKTCQTCNAIEGSAIGHNFNNGVCSACNMLNPNYYQLAQTAYTYEKTRQVYPHSIDMISAEAGTVGGELAVKFNFFALDASGRRQWYVKYYTYTPNGVNIASFSIGSVDFVSIASMSTNSIVS